MVVLELALSACRCLLEREHGTPRIALRGNITIGPILGCQGHMRSSQALVPDKSRVFMNSHDSEGSNILGLLACAGKMTGNRRNAKVKVTYAPSSA
jgi:hypothetical protein